MKGKNMTKIFRTLLVLALIVGASMLSTTPARAQSVYGSIIGTITDKTGAAIPGATVTIKDEAKGTIVTVTSNASGDYNVPHLIPDVYDLKVSMKGYNTFETVGIQVEADTAPRIDPTLGVGSVETTVEVSAESQPELKTVSSDVSTVFDQQQVSSLPVGDQNFTNLQLLLPGAQLLGWSHAADENPQASKQIQVDGQAFGGTAFELDGTDNEDPILGIIVINPATDAVTETKITTQNFDAELGKAVSAVVTAQTRSGTNHFHGSVYDFRTGNANLARDPFSQPKSTGLPAGLKNRMGASIGGPILKDKAFFFFNFEGQRQKVGTSATDTVPTSLLTESCLGNTTNSAAQVAAGYTGCDFSEYNSTATGAPGSTGNIYDNAGQFYVANGNKPAPFPSNVIPKSMLSAQALAFLKMIEPYTKGIALTPGSGSVAGLDKNFNENGTGLFNSNQWTERVDYTLNEKTHVFERFSRFTDLLSGAVMFGAAGGPGFGINNYGGNSNGWNDSLATGMDIAISPKLLTDFRLGYYRYNVIDTKHDQSATLATTLNIPGINLGTFFTGGSPGFLLANVPSGGGGTQNNPVFGDGLGINRCNCPLTEREDQGQIVNNWTMIVGNHTIKLGADLRYGRNLRVPSDSDRDGELHFGNGPTSNQNLATQGGLGWATYMLGLVSKQNSSGDNAFARYVSTSTNAKEFQKRTFFYGQDTWRAGKKLTLNLGLRWDIYFPESVNGPGNGALLNISDGYLHVAGIGSIPSDLGWTIQKAKQFAPRLGVTYQLDSKTVVRAGYGRSFDTGVFGSIFGHTVTQNIPVLAKQVIQNNNITQPAFTLAAGPAPFVNYKTPSNGLLPNPGAAVSSSSRANPLHFTTIDAWNLSVQRQIIPSMTLTVAYVGNKGTHTLGDGDSNGTNPNESAISLPGSVNTYNQQTLHFDPKVPANTIASNGGVSTTAFLTRYYWAKLPACSDGNYTNPGGTFISSGMCGWTNGIAYRGDDQNTEFDALQITLQKNMSHGLAATVNYQWASAFDETSGFYTWSHSATHGRDSNVRDQQVVLYGSYDLPFGKGKQFVPHANEVTDLLVGGWQLSGTMNISGGLPFSLGYNECGANISNGNCSPNQSGKMATSLSGFLPGSNGTGTRTFYPAHTLGDGTFSNPGLDTIGNAGINTYRGPNFFTSDLALTKGFSVWEDVAIKFRFDAFNAFNHINPGNPGGNIESLGTISSEANGCVGETCGPRQVEFSLRAQF
jgi:hypothetical protein